MADQKLCTNCGRPVNAEDGPARRLCRACRKAAWEKLKREQGK